MRPLFNNLFSIVVLLLWALGAVAQSVTIRPNVVSTPRLTYDVITALPNPQEGDTVYDLTFKCLRVYNGSKWVCTFQNPTNPTPNMAAIAQVGGKNFDYGIGIAVDGSGNVYVTGYFAGTATFGTTTLTSAGGADIFVAKYNSSGTLQWVRQAGGTNFDYGIEIEVDGSGNVYITGYFGGTATFGTTTLTSAGNADIFLAKYNGSGTLQWVQKAGGATIDYGNSIAVDGIGNVYVTGYFTSTAVFGTTPLTASGIADIYLVKYNSTGTLQWVRQAGGTADDRGYGVVVDGSNNVYVTGFFQSTATFGTTNLISAGVEDIFVAKYNSSGTLQWVQKAGGTGDDRGYGLAADGSGNVYITGYFSGTAAFGSTNLTSAGGNDVFVTEYNGSGALQWVQKAGGTSRDIGNSIAVDGSRNVYVTGSFEVTATFDTTPVTSAGFWDIFVAKYNSNGTLQWVQKAGGTGDDRGNGIAVDGSGNVYITGGFEGRATFGTTNLTTAGNDDVFVARIDW